MDRLGRQALSFLLSSTVSSRRFVAYLGAILITLAACQDQPAFSRGAGSLEDQAPPPISITSQIPPVSCADSIVGLAHLVEMSAIVPGDSPLKTTRRAPSWLPGLIRDVVVDRMGVLALDAQSAEVVQLDRQLRIMGRFGGEGAGPDELQSPNALARAGDGTIWVTQMRPAALRAFNPTGDGIRTLTLRRPVQDIAITSAGEILVSHLVSFEQRDRDLGDDTLTLVSSVRDTEGVAQPVYSVERSRLAPPLFELPGPLDVELRTFQTGDYVLVPHSGALAMLSGGSTSRVYRPCVAPEVETAYQRQRQEFEPGRPGQSAILLATDALVHDGEVFMIGPLHNADGNYLRHRFARDGTYLGSLEISGEFIDLPERVRFMGHPDTLFAYGGTGVMATFAILDEVEWGRRFPSGR